MLAHHRIVDGIVILDKDPQHHVIHVKQFYSSVRKDKSLEKWKFCCTEVTFGESISSEGYHLDSSITAAILVSHTHNLYKT